MPYEAHYVVLHVGNGPSRLEEQQSGFSPMIVRDSQPRFNLSNDIWIERLDEQFAKNIQKACEPPHHNIDDARFDRHLYAFVRRVPGVEKSKYEGMTDLHATIALSRLVNPTSTGDRYCAQVFRDGDNNSPIFAIRYVGVSPDVILGRKNRDWLSEDDGRMLLKLMPWISTSKQMHGKVHRAYWNHENAMRSYYLDIRWTLIISAFESLLNTKDNDVTWQFRDRVRQLGAEFNLPFTDEELRIAYKLRSKLVHGESFLSGMTNTLPENEHTPLYERLESLLRETVERCLLDQTFGDLFRNNASVNKRWRLNPNPQRKRGSICRKIRSVCR